LPISGGTLDDVVAFVNVNSKPNQEKQIDWTWKIRVGMVVELEVVLGAQEKGQKRTSELPENHVRPLMEAWRDLKTGSLQISTRL
jgi:hypothetical protein